MSVNTEIFAVDTLLNAPDTKTASGFYLLF